MPIVLAIEPDRRQAAHLTSIVGRQVGAELILANTTERALDAIGNRAPDLVLVPALLSPRDDAALAAALRVIAAAAHVRTLTIPVLASGTTRATPGGMLAKWRRRRAASPAPDGCDPAVFGEQISAYLREAAGERADLDQEPLEVAPPIAIEPLAAVEPPAPPSPIEEPPAPPSPAKHPVTESIEPWAAAPVHSWAADPDEPPLIDLSEEVAGLSEGAGGGLFDGERAGIDTISAETDEPELDAFDLLPAILEPPGGARPAAAPIAETRPDALSVEPPAPPRADIEPWVPMYLTPGRMWPALEGMPADTPAPRTEQPDWIELVASLRQDLERRRTDRPATVADPMAPRPSDGGETDARRLVKKQTRHQRKSKPIQDEWGFFDPEQCGFSTLLAKLEEITEDAGIADC